MPYYPPGGSGGGGQVGTRAVSQVASAGLTTGATPYSIGDQVGTLVEMTGLASVAGGKGVLTGITITDDADVMVACDLVIFKETVTLSGGDNNAFAVSDADLDKAIALITMPGFVDVGNNRISNLNLQQPYECTGTSLFVGVIDRAAHNQFGAVTDLLFTFRAIQD